MVNEDGVLSEAGVVGSFGRYHLFASLGKGGMADVFLAVARGQLGVNKLAVVKRLRSTLSTDHGFLRMFIDEGRLATRLNHPNVVHTYEVGEENGVYCIAMEYLEGQPLNRLLRETIKRGEMIDERIAARIAADALSGLQHAHELADYDGRPLQIIHRDVSPHNIFLTYSGQVKIVDFGIAKAALSTTETEVGVLKGKVAYMSPEQAIGGHIDQRSDLFAMGICLWEMLTQRRLMGNDNAAATLHRLLNEPIPSVSTIRPDVSSRLDQIVRKALQKDANLRYQSAADFREALERFIAETGGCRPEDVGAFLSSRFAEVRSEAQRRVQRHMDFLSKAANTAELAALNARGMRELHGSPTTGSGGVSIGNVPGSSASSSGIVANARAVELGPSLPPRPLDASAPMGREKRPIVPILVGVVAFLGVAVLFLILQVIRSGQKPVVTDEPSGPVASTVPTSTVSAPPVDGVGVLGPTDHPPPKLPEPPAGEEAKPPHGKHLPSHPASGLTKAQPSAAASSGTTEKGLLKVDTYPWTNVYLDGKLLGATPLINVSLPAGSYALRFENAEQGVKSTVNVTIKPGETTNLKTLAFK